MKTLVRPGRKVTINSLETSESKGLSTILYCRKCHGEYSTTVGDYSFWIKPEQAFKCCKVNNILIVKG